METIAVIGLGYVGLPLAVEFGKFRKVIGFDIDRARIQQLSDGKDLTLEISKEELLEATNLILTADSKEISQAEVFIITVPTPIDEYKNPDLRPLITASQTVGDLLKCGDLVIYESTVYPGCTEEICVPELEKASGLIFNKDFHCGYSPERINPGDKDHTLADIVKITSGSTASTLDRVDELYRQIIKAGTHRASSLKVAEAAKVIENTQRDLNIAFVNELAIIFNRLEIDTEEVLQAASSKWNFMPFRPGLVGGHCIGVDPYYLTYKAESIGHHPEVILSGRRINDSMGQYVVNRVIKIMSKKGLAIHGSRGLVLGITFKENCPDIRNTKVIDIIKELQEFGVAVDVFDPVANRHEVEQQYKIKMKRPAEGYYDLVILAVPHDELMILNPKSFLNVDGVLFDVKSKLEASTWNFRL